MRCQQIEEHICALHAKVSPSTEAGLVTTVRLEQAPMQAQLALPMTLLSIAVPPAALILLLKLATSTSLVGILPEPGAGVVSATGSILQASHICYTLAYLYSLPHTRMPVPESN